MAREKRVSVRLSHNELQILEDLKKAFLDQHHLHLSDSDIVRQSLLFMYNSTIGKEGGKD